MINIIETNDRTDFLISEDDRNEIQETLYFYSIPGMVESILEGVNTPLDECIPENEVEW